MVAVSRTLYGAVIGAFLAGCTTGQELPAVPPVVAPRPQEYTCESQRKAAAEFARLPDGSEVKRYIIDYGTLRRANRAALKLPEPRACG